MRSQRRNSCAQMRFASRVLKKLQLYVISHITDSMHNNYITIQQPIMAYATVFKINITASNDRKHIIAKDVLALAGAKGDKLEKQYQKFQRRGHLDFCTTWYDWESDLRRASRSISSETWWNPKTKEFQTSLHLHDGEMLNIEGFGDDDEDIWRAVVTNRKFSLEYCLRVEYINKVSCESDKNCTGCQDCAERLPIYD